MEFLEMRSFPGQAPGVVGGAVAGTTVALVQERLFAATFGQGQARPGDPALARSGHSPFLGEPGFFGGAVPSAPGDASSAAANGVVSRVAGSVSQPAYTAHAAAEGSPGPGGAADLFANAFPDGLTLDGVLADDFAPRPPHAPGGWPDTNGGRNRQPTDAGDDQAGPRQETPTTLGQPPAAAAAPLGNDSGGAIPGRPSLPPASPFAAPAGSSASASQGSPAAATPAAGATPAAATPPTIAGLDPLAAVTPAVSASPYAYSAPAGTAPAPVSPPGQGGGSHLLPPGPPPPCGPPQHTISVSPASVSVTESSTVSGQVGTFIDHDNNNDPGKYSVSIAWGDGTTSAPSSVTTNGGCGHFAVTASHQYVDELSGTVTMTVTDTDGDQGSGTTSATISDGSLTASAATIPTIPAGGKFSGTVATFTDASTYSTTLDFSATITWGDGQSSTGDIAPTNTSGGFKVMGTHTYGSTGSDTVSVTITDDGGKTASASETASVTNSAWLVTLPAPVIGVDPVHAANVPFGAAALNPQDGDVSIQQPLDFQQSVTDASLDDQATGYGPAALVYHSDTVNVQPILQPVLYSGSSTSVPSQIQAQLTWNNGTPQSWLTFATTNHSVGDAYLLPVQVANPVTASGVYPWSVEIKATLGPGNVIDQTVTGSMVVVVTDASGNVVGPGWSMPFAPTLISVTGGLLWVDGSQGSRYFQNGPSNLYNSPPFDYGSLVKNGDNSYTYTAKDQTKWNFSSSGPLATVVDPHGLTASLTYSSGNLATITSPDGGVTTFNYSSSLLAAVTEPGNRVVTLTHDGSHNLTGLATPDGSSRTLGYTATHQLNSDVWGSQQVTYSYDSHSAAVTNIDRGQGATLTFQAQDSVDLTGGVAGYANDAVAVSKDALGQLTTMTLDPMGRLIQEQTPDGGVHSWQLDYAGNVVAYTDPLSRTTTLAYQYGDSRGDMTQTTYPDGSSAYFQYNQPFHEPTQVKDTLGNLTTMTYGSQADLLTIRNALNQVTTLTWSNGLLQSSTDPLNHTTSFQYDSNRRLSVKIDALNNRTSFTYDSAGNTATVQDALGRVTTSVYDGMRDLIQQTNALGGITTLAYNFQDQLTSQIDPLAITTSLVYDMHGWQTALTEAVGTAVQRTTTFAYDDLGRKISQTDANNHTSSLSYDAVGRVKTETSAVGGVTTNTYDLAGQLLAITDPLNHTTSFSYNSRGWQTTETDPLNNVTTASYDTEGNRTGTVDARGNRTTYTYDNLNRLIQTQDALGNLGTILYDAAGNVQATVDQRGNRVTFGYDAANRQISRTDQLNHTVTAVLDAVGNVVQSIDALGNATTMVYDGLNRRTSVQDPGGGIATTVFDADSNVLATVDPLGNRTSYTYDALNRAYQMQDPRGGLTTVVLDVVDNTLAVVDPVGNRTSFQYDAANRLTQQTDPLNDSATFAYDLANRLTSTTDRDGRRRDITYDADNRETSEAWVVSGTTVNTLTYTFDAVGNLLGAANAAGAYTMTYDALNRVSTQQEPFALTLTMTYDAVGNRTLLQDSFGGTTTSVYDAANRLTSRQFGGTGQTPLRIDLTYTARDQVATETRYSNLAGTATVVYSAFTYDTAMRVVNIQHQNASGGILANFTYTYDLESRLYTETDNGMTVTFSYDTINQLTGDGTRSYTYDLNGNRTLSGYQTGTGNQLTSDGVWNFTYDNEGNLIKAVRIAGGLTWTYSYDNINHLTGAQERATDGGTLLLQSTYVYDPFANRIEKDVWTQAGGTTTVTRFGYDGQDIWVDLNGTNALQTRYLHSDAVDDLFVRVSAGGTAAWYLTDRLGSVRNITDNSGSVHDTIAYDPYGTVLTETSPTFGDRYKYTGRELDAETNLLFNRARYYDTTHGRWISQDPLCFGAGDANLYRYVSNSPTNWIDSSGDAGKPPAATLERPVPLVPPATLGRPVPAPAPPAPPRLPIDFHLPLTGFDGRRPIWDFPVTSNASGPRLPAVPGVSMRGPVYGSQIGIRFKPSSLQIVGTYVSPDGTEHVLSIGPQKKPLGQELESLILTPKKPPAKPGVNINYEVRPPVH
jgi:RHS repeat-associated protein